VKKFWSPGLGAYLARHPLAGWTLARAGWRFRSNGWWHRAPYLPLPDVTYWHFRVTTYAGDGASSLSPDAMLDAAAWALSQPAGR
jgi:hypothetical protein